MKKIADSRKLIGATSASTLKELSTLYKGLMKSHHPDRFPNDEEKREEAEEFSKHLIDAYKFLESIHPETHVSNAAEFEQTVASSITNWHHKGLTLHLTFGDGSTFEFYGVQPKTFNKFVATDGNVRFAKRHIFDSYTHRRLTGASPAED